MLVALCSLLLALSFPAEAQQPAKVSRIGYLALAPLSTVSPRIEIFRQSLRELGYVEGKNMVIEYRHAEGKLDRLSALSAELVRLKVDVIVTGGGGGVNHTATDTNKTIPIVKADDDNRF